MKKFTSILMAALLVLSLATFLSIPTTAASWAGGVSPDFAGGDGTEASPYRIETAQDLAYLAKKVNEDGELFAGKYIKLINDIDLGGVAWEPIGDRSVAATYTFSGTFDGDGHVISGLHVETANADGGLFGRITSATIKNLTVKGDKVEAAKYAGGIVGYALKGSVIYNCHAQIESVRGITTGGIVARMQDVTAEGDFGVIKGCTSSCNVTSVADKNVFAGGIVGAVGAADISWCINTGKIANEGGATTLLAVGGIVGVQGANSATANIRNCYNTGDISGVVVCDATNVGGIVGRAAHITAETYLENCFSTGRVTVTGESGAAIDGKCGSLIGQIRYVLFMSNCYTSIPVSDCPEVGSDPNACVEAGNITILTEAQMKGADAVNNMKLGAGWVADASGFPTMDLSQVKDEETTVPEETTTPAPDTTPSPTEDTTPAPTEDTTPAPEETTTPAPTTTPTPSDTTTAGGNSGSGDKNGPNVFVILIIVVVVIAAVAVVVVVLGEKKKKK